MNRVFLIGDTHFGHKGILGFESAHRPFATIDEHNEALVARWNSVVNKKDTVYHLGDCVFGRAAFAYLPRLNGIKKLVLGNHDMYPSADYLQHFSKLYGAVELHGCILTHIPVHPSQFPRYRANIHGHTHSRKLDDPRYFCVSAEHNNLTPISMDEAMTRIPTVNARQE